MPTKPIKIIPIAPVEHPAQIERREECGESFDPKGPVEEDGRLNLKRFFSRSIKRHNDKYVIAAPDLP